MLFILLVSLFSLLRIPSYLCFLTHSFPMLPFSTNELIDKCQRSSNDPHKDLRWRYTEYRRGHLKCYVKRSVRPTTLLKKKLWYRCFPMNFAKSLRTPFLQNTSGSSVKSMYKSRRSFVFWNLDTKHFRNKNHFGRHVSANCEHGLNPDYNDHSLVVGPSG